jgi:hypothetical protein
MPLINCDPQLLGGFNGLIPVKLVTGRRERAGRSFVIRGAGHADQRNRGVKVAQEANCF